MLSSIPLLLAAALAPTAALAQLLDASAVGPLTSLSSKQTKTCSVLDYGGVADGTTDIGPALTEAFSSCVTSGSTLVVPEGNYSIATGVTLSGTDAWAFQLDGLLTLTEDGDFGGNAIIVEHATDFEMFSSNGLGAIQGQGYLTRKSGGSQNARLLRFISVTSYAVHDLILVDSPTFHMVHNTATNLELYHITVRGADLGGSDGIDLTCTSNCYLHHIEVTNRDECISVKTPSLNVLIEEIYCNQSGGMSIGSLDAGNGGAEIEFIQMRNIYIHQCTEMLMIKTYPGGDGSVGYVRNSVFENFWAYDTTYALDIDQYWYEHTTPDTGAIALYNLEFRNWTGSVDNGINRGPIVIRGSDIVPLQNITLEDFAMWTETKDEVVLQCQNVYGTGYCANTADATTAFTSDLTMTTTMSGYVSAVSPAWGVGTAGYGTTEPIPVYTPAVFWSVSSASVQGATAAAEAVSTSVSSAVSTEVAAVASTPVSSSVVVTATASSAAVATTEAVTSSAASSTVAAASTITSAPAAFPWGGHGPGFPGRSGAPGRMRRW